MKGSTQAVQCLCQDDRFSNTCGNVVRGHWASGSSRQVQPSTWHVATICVDLEKRQEMQIVLDGEQHLVARDRSLFAPEGLFSAPKWCCKHCKHVDK